MLVSTIRFTSLTLLPILLLYNSGCSGDLTRPKALELLKQNVEGGLRGSTASVRGDIWISTPDDGQKSSRLIAKNFLDALKDAGYLKGPTSREHTLVWTSGVDYFYWPISRQDVASEQSPRLTVMVSKPTITEVTGITSEGDTAVAECTVTNVPTETFKAINSILEKLSAKGQDPRANAWANSFIFDAGRWPAEESLSSQETRRYNFRKYDDGWRVEGSL